MPFCSWPARRTHPPADLREDAGRDARAGRHDADCLKGQDAVELSFPAEQSGAARTIKAASVDGRGVAGKGLTSAAFTGDVDYREMGSGVNRVAKSAVLDVLLKPGTSAIEEAKFTRNARFATESGLFAVRRRGALCTRQRDARTERERAWGSRGRTLTTTRSM